VKLLCLLLGHKVERVFTPSGSEAEVCLRCGRILRLRLFDVLKDLQKTAKEASKP